ncbi:MAG TPA: MFS transporter, partial [Bradyrhizobium sp.]|nr:MFS transporter [Bradyrhizobium sp.]
ELSADAGTTSANRAGVYLAILQLVFTLGWTTYVIYLPKLAADVGIAPESILPMVVMDSGLVASRRPGMTKGYSFAG